ncbi:MAG: outer membrane protein assembly factor BamC [Sodalis sp. (in: enterobacteria)]
MTHNASGNSTWRNLGAKYPDLRNIDYYKVQIADLGDRNTLQFINPKRHALTQWKSGALLAAFQAAFSQSSTR